MNKILENLSKKKILILGFGREGLSTLNFLRKYFPEKDITIADQNPVILKDKNVSFNVGKNYLDDILKYDIIFKSPGITYKVPQIANASKKRKIYSQTRLFFDLCKGTIVGVTGTKGKSTTTTLIYEILKSSGKKAVLLGNIGKPCLDYLDKDLGKGTFFSFELSSHQLFDLKKSPHVAVFLNIFREHLDYYRSFNDYFKAKANIAKYQRNNDFFIYNSNFPRIGKVALSTRARSFGFTINKNKLSDCFLDGNKIIFLKPNRDEVIETDEIPLRGIHNLNNVMAAVLAARCLGIDYSVMHKAIKKFHPLEHRLQMVGKYKEIEFYDDTLATIPEATIAAIKSFEGRIGTIILGGSDRGQNFNNLAREVLKAKIENVILFPDTGRRIWSDIKSQKEGYLPRAVNVNNMDEAVSACYRFTPKGKICLLSSASPSFSLFKNYEEKSTMFRKAVIIYGLKSRQ